MTDVILINSAITLEETKPTKGMHEGDESSNEPLALLYIAANLQKHGYSVKIIDTFPQKMTLKKIMLIIQKEKPVLVGISSLTPGIRTSVILGKAIKKNFGSKVAVGLGGPHVNSDPTFIKRFPFFDFCVVGEGELTIVELVKRLKRGKKVKGIISGEIVEDLDALPFPARELINLKDYFRQEEDKKFFTATILGSRGCPYKCIFCSKADHQRRVRFRSGKNIAGEMESLYRQGIFQFSFVDDTLTLNKQNVLDLCQEIILRKMKVRWKAMTRANCLDKEILTSLSQAGCDDLFFGVESGSEKIRNEIIHKNVTDEEIKKAISLCHEYKIHTNIFLMVGFPGETKKELQETINIGHKTGVDLLGIRITVPLPGAEIFSYAVREKIISGSVIDDYASGKLGIGFVGHWPLFVPKGLSLKDLVWAKKETYRKFYLSPRFFLRRFSYYLKNPRRLKEDWGLYKIGPGVLLRGKSKGSMS